MHCQPISYRSIKNFSPLFSSYTERDEKLLPFISAYPDLGNLKNQIERKSAQFSPHLRSLLQNRLKVQMGHELFPDQKENIERLTSENTFSVSCGHQLNLAGGPVYVAYKILTVIKLAEILNKEFPQFQFVPIHWIATEDHDRDEICAFRYLSQNYNFSLNESGAVGRMSSVNLSEQMKRIEGFPDWMANSYNSEYNLTKATRTWLQYVFGERGLLVIDGDDPEFKKEFYPLAIKELMHPWVERALNETSENLNKIGFKEQIHARPVNLFYLKDGERLRLETTEQIIHTVDGEYKWSMEEAQTFFQNNPECLSPNVAFRPLYSQLILPDVAFIGGPAEISYWLQLGQVFKEGDVPMPLLIPRFSALYVSKVQAKKMDHLNLKPADLFKEWTTLKRELFVPHGLMPDFDFIFEPMVKWAESVDSTMVPAAKAEISRIMKRADHLQNRIRKAAERKNEIQISQITNLNQSLFPNGNLQERTDSWLSFKVGDPNWINKIYSQIDPLDLQFQILLDQD